MPSQFEKPIYDDPKHPIYSPSRRIHLILLYLYGDNLPEIEKKYAKSHGEDWTRHLETMIKFFPEATCATSIINHVYNLARRHGIA